MNLNPITPRGRNLPSLADEPDTNSESYKPSDVPVLPAPTNSAAFNAGAGSTRFRSFAENDMADLRRRQAAARQAADIPTLPGAAVSSPAPSAIPTLPAADNIPSAIPTLPAESTIPSPALNLPTAENTSSAVPTLPAAENTSSAVPTLPAAENTPSTVPTLQGATDSLTPLPTQKNPSRISIVDGNVNVGEGDGNAQIRVERSGGSEGRVSVDYQTFSNTAQDNADFTPTTGTVTFEDGETRKTIEVPIVDDSDAEGSETFNLTIDSARADTDSDTEVSLGAPRTATVSIADNDSAPPEPTTAPTAPTKVADSGAEPKAVTVVDGLTKPTSIDFSPDGRNMYVAEQGGVIKVVRDGVQQSAPALDIRDRVNGTRDRGLLDVAVHPDIENHPYIYAIYTYDPPQVNDNPDDPLAGPDKNGNRAGRISRFTLDAASNYTTADPDSEVVLAGKNSTWENFNAFANSTNNFDEPPAGVNPDGSYVQDFIATDSESHTVGSVEFGPDGNLYASIGDGTSYNRVDPRSVRTVDNNSLSGKILRLDPISGEGLSDNPFYTGDPNDNASKVYQSGLRNPFRISVAESGKVYIGDVGWSSYEEINAGEPGANFGWPFFEGGKGQNSRTSQYENLPEAAEFYANTKVTPGIYSASHEQDGANAIVLGDIYTGDKLPAKYKGDLFFSDLQTGVVNNANLDANGNIESIEQFATGAQYVVQTVQSPDGDLYYVNVVEGEVGRWEVTEPS